MLKPREEVLHKISECFVFVAKKYFPKMFIYPFVIIYGYKLFYVINHNVEPTYRIVFSNLSVVIGVFMMIDFIYRYATYDCWNDSSIKSCHDETKSNDRTEWIRACHEAGHFFIARKLEVPIKEVNIINDSNSGGKLILDMPNTYKASQIKKVVMVIYAGLITEKILIGEASDGCMGSDTSDLEVAKMLLRKYVILTDNSISLTGYEDVYIKNKCIELSMLWRDEVQSLLIEHTNELKEIADQLVEKKIIKVA